MVTLHCIVDRIHSMREQERNDFYGCDFHQLPTPPRPQHQHEEASSSLSCSDNNAVIIINNNNNCSSSSSSWGGSRRDDGTIPRHNSSIGGGSTAATTPASMTTATTTAMTTTVAPSGSVSASDQYRRGCLNSSWREKIVHWSYDVVDHFDMSREVVAISLDLFDRFLACRHHRPDDADGEGGGGGSSFVVVDGKLALLLSLTTLHLAIKIHDVKKIRIATLASLSRGQFDPSDIEAMEWTVLTVLRWRVHPPTPYAFLYHVLCGMLPPEICPDVRRDLLETSRYVAELTVCDSYFVGRRPSSIATAILLHLLGGEDDEDDHPHDGRSSCRCETNEYDDVVVVDEDDDDNNNCDYDSDYDDDHDGDHYFRADDDIVMSPPPPRPKKQHLLSQDQRHRFWGDVRDKLQIHVYDPDVLAARERLASVFDSHIGGGSEPQQQQQREEMARSSSSSSSSSCRHCNNARHHHRHHQQPAQHRRRNNRGNDDHDRPHTAEDEEDEEFCTSPSSTVDDAVMLRNITKNNALVTTTNTATMKKNNHHEKMLGVVTAMEAAATAA